MTKERNRNELSTQAIEEKGAFLMNKIKVDFHNSSVSYVPREDIKYAVGYSRETSKVLPAFQKKVLAELDSVVADVGGGRLAIVKK